MERVEIKTDFIKLDQFLKYANVVESGAVAKNFIKDGKVKVNGEVALERGKKLHRGDLIQIENLVFEIF